MPVAVIAVPVWVELEGVVLGNSWVLCIPGAICFFVQEQARKGLIARY
jgi:hypothetical protein